MQCWPRQKQPPEEFCKKGVIRNFTKFTENTCTIVSFFAEACNFIKKDTLAQVFSCEFCDISKNTFFTEHIWATASAQIDPDKIVNYFSVKSLKTVDRHQTHWFTLVSFLCNFGSGRSKQRCIWLFSCEKMTISRSSRSQMFFKKGVFKNFAIFTGKHLCWNLSLTTLLS